MEGGGGEPGSPEPRGRWFTRASKSRRLVGASRRSESTDGTDVVSDRTRKASSAERGRDQSGPDSAFPAQNSRRRLPSDPKRALGSQARQRKLPSGAARAPGSSSTGSHLQEVATLVELGNLAVVVDGAALAPIEEVICTAELTA